MQEGARVRGNREVRWLRFVVLLLALPLLTAATVTIRNSDLLVEGNTQLGDAAADTTTVKGPSTFEADATLSGVDLLLTTNAAQVRATHATDGYVLNLDNQTNTGVYYSAAVNNLWEWHQSGTQRAYVDLDNGDAQFEGTMTATIYYDRNSTSYFVDPASPLSGRLWGNLSIGFGGAADDDYLYFDNAGEYVRWSDAASQFEFSDDLQVSGNLVVTGNISIGGDPYVDEAGDTMTGDLTMSGTDVLLSTSAAQIRSTHTADAWIINVDNETNTGIFYQAAALNRWGWYQLGTQRAYLDLDDGSMQLDGQLFVDSALDPGLTLGAGTSAYFQLGDTAAKIYRPASNRIFVRAESTDNVAQFASYGLYLPQDPGISFYAGGDLEVGYASAADDDTIYFDSSALTEWIQWNDGAGAFLLSDDLVIGGSSYIDDDTTFGENADDWIQLAGYIEFKTNSASYGLVVREDSSTNYVGITSEAGYAYLADSNVATSYFLRGNSDDVVLGTSISSRHDWWGYLSGGNGDTHRIYPGGVNWGYVGDSVTYWFAMYASSFSPPSSKTYKKDIKYLDDADYDRMMEDLERLPLVFYRYKKETSRPELENEAKYKATPHLGTLAEDAPAYVQDHTFRAVSLYDLTSFALAGVKHNRASVKSLEEKVQELERQVTASGLASVTGPETWVPFPEGFAADLDRGSASPVVTATPNVRGVHLAVTSWDARGFLVAAEPAVPGAAFGWIAVATLPKAPKEPARPDPEYWKENLIVSDDVKDFMRSWILRSHKADLRQERKDYPNGRHGPQPDRAPDAVPPEEAPQPDAPPASARVVDPAR